MDTKERTLTNFMCTLEVGDPGERPRQEEEEAGALVVGAALAAVLMGPG